MFRHLRGLPMLLVLAVLTACASTSPRPAPASQGSPSSAQPAAGAPPASSSAAGDAGIGIVLQAKDGTLFIRSVLRDGPAGQSGIVPGDTITKIEGTSTEGMTLEQAVAKLRGPAGSNVALTVERGSESRNYVITRDVLKVPASSGGR